MSLRPERPATIRLSVDEYAQVELLAREREMQPEHWLADIARVAIWERRDPVAPMRLREKEITRLQQEVVRLTNTIMRMKIGPTQ